MIFTVPYKHSKQLLSVTVKSLRQLFFEIIKPSRLPLYENGSGLVKSSVQSESETVGSFTFAVLGKAADGQYRHTLRGGFFQKCLKSSPRRGLYTENFTLQFLSPCKICHYS